MHAFLMCTLTVSIILLPLHKQYEKTQKTARAAFGDHWSDWLHNTFLPVNLITKTFLNNQSTLMGSK